MRRLLLGLVICVPLLVFAQDPNLSTDTTFPGDKPATKSGSVPNAPAPANKPASNVPDAPTPTNKSASNVPDAPSPSPSTSSKPAEDKETTPPAEDASKPPTSAPLPRSDGESSSKDNLPDMSPPPGDEKHTGAELPSDVEEMRPWNPHQADKNVEIGDFYYKKSNYRAAEGRYQEALRVSVESRGGYVQARRSGREAGQAGRRRRKNYSTYLQDPAEGTGSGKNTESFRSARWSGSGYGAEHEWSSRGGQY